MFGRKARRIEMLSRLLLRTQKDVLMLKARFDRLEKLVIVGTTRLDIHAQRLGVLEDDVENLK